jgi:hypothetical protein
MARMKALRVGRIGLALAALPVLGSIAYADDASPSAQQIRSAALEYDAGRRAYLDKDYESAADHFENAFHDAPSAEALRNAIRARRKARQLARAATLAELASLKYPKDAPTAVVVREALAESQVKLHKITLTCAPECGVAADGRAITLSDAPKAVFFLEPGSHSLEVSWSGDRTKQQALTARAGGSDELSFEAPALTPPSAAAVPPAQAPTGLVGLPPPSGSTEQTPITHVKPFGPAVFVTAAVITAGGAGFTVWSGFNAENSPGTSVVKTECAGKGPSCPAYQEGLSAQLRTNIALGATGAAALATCLLGVFFTQWSPRKSPTASVTLEPAVGLDSHRPRVGLLARF